MSVVTDPKELQVYATRIRDQRLVLERGLLRVRGIPFGQMGARRIDVRAAKKASPV